MHSFFKTTSEALEVFISDQISIIKLTEDNLYNLTKIELILPNSNSVTLFYLFTKQNTFQLDVSLSSNANLALIVNSYGLIINNETHIEAEQVFITNYPVDEKHFNETRDLLLTWSGIDHYMINYGDIFAKSNKNSAIAFDKFINRGSISNNIDCETYMGWKEGQLVPAMFYEFYKYEWEFL